MNPTPGEFDLIQRFFSRPPGGGTLLGGGDDAALLVPSAGQVLTISCDTLVAGRHFFADVDPVALGYKALAVNLSDLAAMGATPRWALLSLTLPTVDVEWLSGFSAGFYALADQFSVSLVGGDTTYGPLNLGVTVLGEVPAGTALQRSGAQAGDDIWVSGCLGDAAAALQALQGHMSVSNVDFPQLRERLERPSARVALGVALRGVASAAMDISDGLVGDAGHMASASGVALNLDRDAIPLSPWWQQHRQHALFDTCVLAGGDDYELLFTAPVSQRAALLAHAVQLQVPLSIVGNVTLGAGVHWRDCHGAVVDVNVLGFDHFRQQEG